MISFANNKRRAQVSAMVVLLFLLCTPEWCIAQMQVLAFSQTDMLQIDGFNNGNVALAPTATVPITIGVFNSQTGMLSPLAAETALLVQLLDANGNAHANLSVSGGVLLPAALGATVVNSTLDISWLGIGPTTATLVVADTSGVLPVLSLSILLDPSLSPNLHSTVLLIHDANGNNVYDALDTRISSCAVEAHPLHYLLQADGDAYVLDIPQYSGGFPFYVRPLPCVGWRPVEEQGTAIANETADTTLIFMEAASTTATFSGFQHGLFGQVLGQVEDSLFTLSGFAERASVVVSMNTPSWYTTGLATPLPGSAEPSFSLSAFGEQEHCFSCQLGTLAVVCASGAETVSPDFSASGSATYRLTVYHKGAVVYTEDNRSGAGVILPRTVRRWGVETGAFVVEELLPRTIRIANGAAVFGDRIVFTPQNTTNPFSALLAVEITGAEMESLALYKHEVRRFGMVQTCTGNALLGTVEDEDGLLHVRGGDTGGLVITHPSANGITVRWAAPELNTQSTQAWVTIEARTAEEALTLGEIALHTGANNISYCRTPFSSYGGQERTFSVYNNDALVTTATTTEETIAWYTEQPMGCKATTLYGEQGYRLLWQNSTELTLPNGQHVEGNALFVAFRTTNRGWYSLLDVTLKPRQAAMMQVESTEGSNDVLTLAATITIIGEVFDDANGNGNRDAKEVGRPGRKVYVYRSDSVKMDSIMTDVHGVYSKAYRYLAGHAMPAPVFVRVEPAGGWRQTLPAPPLSPLFYDLVAMGVDYSRDTTIDRLHFGETTNIPVNTNHTLSICYGIDDNFSANGSDEVTSPSTALSTWLTEGEHAALEYFDPIPRDLWFAHSLPTLCTAECIATGATITMRLRAEHSLSYNDAIVLQKNGQRLWSAPIATLTTSQTWFADRTEDFTLNLTALPQGDGTTVNLSSALQNGDVDVLISDDTGIDYLTYLVNLSCTEAGSPLPTSITDEQTDVFHARLFPTPNSGTGHIEFSLAQSEAVTISLVDVLQREMVRLLDATPLPSGNHSLGFSLPFLPAGTYFLRITTGTAMSSYRFVLLH